MAAKMSLCNISYTYEHYIGINIEEVSKKLYHYLVLEIFIQNCDGTRYKKRHRFHPIGRNSNKNEKSGMRQLKISKDIIRKATARKQIESNEEGCLPELRPQIDFHDFLK